MRAVKGGKGEREEMNDKRKKHDPEPQGQDKTRIILRNNYKKGVKSRVEGNARGGELGANGEEEQIDSQQHGQGPTHIVSPQNRRKLK